MKKIIWFVAMLLLAVSTQAQVAALRQVFSSGGSVASSATINASQTLGEAIIGTSSTSASVIATQGFEQPDNFTTSIETPEGYMLDVSVYPNPVGDLMNIKLEGTITSPIQIELYDASGRLIPGWTREVRQTGIIEQPAAQLASGAYFLRVSQTNGTPLRTLPIVKR